MRLCKFAILTQARLRQDSGKRDSQSRWKRDFASWSCWNRANTISQPRNVGTGSTFRGFVLHIFLSGSAGITRWREEGIRGRALPQQSILLPFANLYIGIQMQQQQFFQGYHIINLCNKMTHGRSSSTISGISSVICQEVHFSSSPLDRTFETYMAYRINPVDLR